MPHSSFSLLVLLAACAPPPTFYTDGGQLSVTDPEVVDLQGEGGPSPFLAGTELCPNIDAEGDSGVPDDYDALDCFAQTFEGPVAVAGECLVFESPGVVDWTFTAQVCPSNDFGYAPMDDHVAIEVVAAADVEGYLAMQLEDAAESAEGQEGLTIIRPANWQVEEGATWRIVEGQSFDLAPRLRTRGEGVAVAWSGGLLQSDGAATVLALEEVGAYRVVAAAGDTSSLTLEVGGESLPVGQVESVPKSIVASVEIALAKMELPESGTSLPYAARAVLRDAAGEIVLGAPVDWRFTPQLLTPGPGNGLPGADYVVFSDKCADPAKTFGEQRAKLTASVGSASDSMEIVWTPRTEADPQEGWVASEDCETACGCASGGPTHGWLAALLGLTALVGRRRAV